jgi:hypothetical protein
MELPACSLIAKIAKVLGASAEQLLKQNHVKA